MLKPTKVILASENPQHGKVPEDFPNMRVEYAWALALDAEMVPLHFLAKSVDKIDADIIFIILPKTSRGYDFLIESFKKARPDIKVGVVQEGPVDYYLNYSPTDQAIYMNTLKQADFISVHNKKDKDYLLGLFPKKQIVRFPTIWQPVYNISKSNVDRQGCIISGNMSPWYGGSFGIFNALDMGISPIAVPASGRMNDEEKRFLKENKVTVLPWVMWNQWMEQLHQYKFGINLMPTRAAGTFSMNCAALGIPCIGFNDLDAQVNTQHPDLCVDRNEVRHVRVLMKRLNEDKTFYRICVDYTIDHANKYLVSHQREYFKKLTEIIKQNEN